MSSTGSTGPDMILGEAALRAQTQAICGLCRNRGHAGGGERTGLLLGWVGGEWVGDAVGFGGAKRGEEAAVYMQTGWRRRPVSPPELQTWGGDAAQRRALASAAAARTRTPLPIRPMELGPSSVANACCPFPGWGPHPQPRAPGAPWGRGGGGRPLWHRGWRRCQWRGRSGKERAPSALRVPTQRRRRRRHTYRPERAPGAGERAPGAGERAEVRARVCVSLRVSLQVSARVCMCVRVCAGGRAEPCASACAGASVRPSVRPALRPALRARSQAGPPRRCASAAESRAPPRGASARPRPREGSPRPGWRRAGGAGGWGRGARQRPGPARGRVAAPQSRIPAFGLPPSPTRLGVPAGPTPALRLPGLGGRGGRSTASISFMIFSSSEPRAWAAPPRLPPEGSRRGRERRNLWGTDRQTDGNRGK